MGWIKHNAIIATGMDFSEGSSLEGISDTRQKVANEIGQCWVTELTEPVVNGYRTFVVAPDGSKEGWTHSDEGDARRDKARAILSESNCHWVEVEYGGTTARVVASDSGEAKA